MFKNFKQWIGIKSYLILNSLPSLTLQHSWKWDNARRTGLSKDRVPKRSASILFMFVRSIHKLMNVKRTLLVVIVGSPRSNYATGRFHLGCCQLVRKVGIMLCGLIILMEYVYKRDYWREIEVTCKGIFI